MLGTSVMGQCQVAEAEAEAEAEAVETFGKLDVLLRCSSEGRSLYELLALRSWELI